MELIIDKPIGPDEWAEFTGVNREISGRHIREKLAAFPEDEHALRIVIDSPGGDVFEGVTIFNAIRSFVRAHPDVHVETYIQGMAASMASVVALAAWAACPERSAVVVEDNSIFMIHNSWGVAIGDRHEMREAADFFEKVDAVLLRAVYVKRTGKSEKDVGAMMDAETWLYGDEIRVAGFADNVLSVVAGGDAHSGRDEAVLSAKAKFRDARAMMQRAAAGCGKKQGGELRAAAMALGFTGEQPPATASGDTPRGKKDKGGCMKLTVEDLKKDNPEVYAAVVAEGEAEGVKKEKARASRLLAMGQKSHCVEYAIECIKAGASPADSAVVDAFMDKGFAARAESARMADCADVPNLNPPKADKNAHEKELMSGFEKGLKTGGYDDGDY